MNLGFIRPENLVSHGLRVFRCLLANSKRAVMCLLLSSTDNSFNLMAWFLLCHSLSTVGQYIEVCTFPNHVQSIECTTGGLQSSCRNISTMINGNRIHLISISSLIAKGLNTYVNKVFLFFLLNKFALSEFTVNMYKHGGLYHLCVCVCAYV